MPIPTNFVLERHAQRSEVVDLRLKSFDAGYCFEEIFFYSFDVPLTHLELVLHVLLVNFELLLQAVCVDDFVTDSETLTFQHLNLFSQADALLFFAFKFFFKGFVDDSHKVVRSEGLPLNISSELKEWY